MNKLIITFLISAFCVLNCFAQTSIWKVSKNGKTLYLGGSIHLLRESDYPLPKEYDSAFVKSDKIVFETDIEKLEDPAFAQSLLTEGTFKDGKDLKGVLTKKNYKKLKKACAKVSLPLDLMTKFKPSMILLTLTSMKYQEMGLSQEGVDKYYHKKGIEANKSFDFLETVEEQKEVLLKMGEGDENNYVKNTLKSFDDVEKDVSNMITDWRKGNSTILNKQLTETKTNFPAIYQSLLVQRNNNWMPKIEKYLTTKEIEFVIVGALHLHGEDGLLALLKAKGYTVEQYKL